MIFPPSSSEAVFDVRQVPALNKLCIGVALGTEYYITEALNFLSSSEHSIGLSSKHVLLLSQIWGRKGLKH